jgi:hypothetical protein
MLSVRDWKGGWVSSLSPCSAASEQAIKKERGNRVQSKYFIAKATYLEKW